MFNRSVYIEQNKKKLYQQNKEWRDRQTTMRPPISNEKKREYYLNSKLKINERCRQRYYLSKELKLFYSILTNN